jgi:integrase
MTLSDVLLEYLATREVSRGYADSMRRTVRKAAAYGVTETRQLLPDTVNGFITKLRRDGSSAVNRSNVRRMLLTIWRYAHERGYVAQPPSLICKVKVILPPPKAWSRDTLAKLLDAAEQDRRPVSTRFENLRWRHVMPVWIAVSFETGLRLGDVLLLNEGNIRNGCVCVTASKTGKVEIKRLSAYAQQGVDRLLSLSPDGTVFRWAVTRRRALVKWKQWLQEQRVSGSSKYLRRSCFTYTEMERPGTAHRFANHSDPNLVWMHYIDKTLLSPPDGPLPLR